MDLLDLGLSSFQLQEMENLEPTLVTAWLEAASKPSVRSPTGFFLTGVRTGQPPRDAGGGEGDRTRAVHLAERWIEFAGLLCDSEEAILDELFEANQGRLRPWRNDLELRARMVHYWQQERERGVEAELEFEARCERARAAREKR